MLRIIAETFVNLYAVELPQLRGQRRVDGVGRVVFNTGTDDLEAI